MHNLAYQFFENTVREVYLGKDVPARDISKAILLRMYNEDISDELSKRVMDTGLIKKLLIAIIAPILSILIKFGFSGGF